MNYIKKFFCRTCEVKIPKWFLITGIILSFIGLINASYLTFDHFNYNSDSFCPIVVDGYGSCHDVTNSEYAEVFGIPLALLGIFYYAFVFGVLVYLTKKNSNFLFGTLFASTLFGFLFSIILVYIQIGPLGAICPYCMLSALISLILFVLDLVLIIQNSIHHKKMLL